jgi:putative transposase
MPRLAPPPLHLNAAEREQLEQLVHRHRTPQQIVLRARIILLADAGQNHREISRDLHISREMARLWRQRWLELSEQSLPVEERLADAPRPGGRMTFSLEQILQLFALACKHPQDYGRAISHWTARELADEMRQQGIVEHISPRHVGRLLEEADLKPHQIQSWLDPPPTPTSRRRSQTFVPSIGRPLNEPNRENGQFQPMR